MAEIKVLDPLLASKIAAGEVIERPSSVVKELMENSIDAGATSVSVYLEDGGARLIRVSDNGEGISRKDALLAFERHATSKISVEDDLEDIRTMGFRGEALASVGAVARVTLRTRRPGEVTGTAVKIEGGATPAVTDDGCPEGTTVEVRDLFYNTPARLKFMKSAPSETGRASDIFKRIALINPAVRFKFSHGSSKPMETAAGSLRERLSDLFGRDAARDAVEVDTPYVAGLISGPGLTYNNSRAVYLYVNGRPVWDKSVVRAVADGYGSLLEGNRYPFAVLDVRVPPGDVDINIHPAKSEVRFKNTRGVYDAVKNAVRLALSKGLAPGGHSHGVDEADAQPRTGYSPAPFTARESGAGYAPGWSQASFNASAGHASADGGLEAGAGGQEVRNPEFLSLRAVGQLWGEFLVAEGDGNGGEFYLIDAHGAAERAAFEALKKNYFAGTGIKKQMLLLPERVETTPAERDELNGAMEWLERLGFEVIEFGPSPKAGGETFLVKAVPALLSSRGCAALLKDLAGELSDAGGSSAVEEKIEGALKRIACHSVIRGARRLTAEEGNALLKTLADTEMAGHCPHGRPVVRKFTRKDVEAMFNRR